MMRRGEIAALLIVGLMAALPWRGHFQKPHNDFYSFRETGRSLVAGELPASMKRAPLFPLLVAGGGSLLSAAFPIVETPDLVAAEWLNGCLFAINGVLIYAVARPRIGRGALWLAVVFVLLPWGIHFSAHAIAEPLLITTVLLTLYLARTHTRWAYVAAAAATMTRYDAGGLVLGLMVADVAGRTAWPADGRRSYRSALRRGALALVPLAVWLSLTVLTWRSAARDHYIEHIAERSEFHLWWVLITPLHQVFSPDRLRLPEMAGWLDGPLRSALLVTLAALAVIGAAVMLRRRDRVAITAAAYFAAYAVVHSFYPFWVDRFAYPLVPVVLLAAGWGIQAVRERLADASGRRRVIARVAAIGAWGVAVMVTVLLVGELITLPLPAAQPAVRESSLLVVALVGLVIVGAAWRGEARVLVLMLALMWYARVQVRETQPIMGTGRELINLVHSARWVNAQLDTKARVVCAEPGILRLHAGTGSDSAARPAGRFIEFDQLRAGAWPDVLAECRERGITHILWHDRQFDEHGEFYFKRWRLDRFEALGGANAPEGLELEHAFAGDPNVRLFRVTAGT